MLELVLVVAVLYALSVAVSFGLMKLIYDEVPAKYALLPVLNIVLLAVDIGPGASRHGAHPRKTPKQELDREEARQYRGPPPPWRPL